MLLAIDTSAGTSVAVVDRDGGILAEHSSDDTRRHAEVIGTLIARSIADAGIEVADLSGVVAGMGPGPFTGLRVGIAAARAFALGAGKLIIPAVSHDAIAICDEVWEHVVFDGAVHRSLMTLPGMRDRTVKIGSAGKIFSLTGWKVGWMCAAPAIASVLAKAHQFLTFTTPPNLQAAAAYGLGKDAAYFAEMRAGYQRSRDRLAAGLSKLGYAVLPSRATYFLNVDLTASGIAMGDVAFAEWLIEQAGVATIPVSAFYADDAVTNVVRLCFAKQDATLDAALERMVRRP